MAKNITLSNLRDKIRQRADIENDNHITDEELNGYINDSIAELYDILVQKNAEDYFVESTTLSFSSGVNTQDLPTDLYKIAGVDLVSSPENIPLKRWDWNKRNNSNQTVKGVYGKSSNLKYRAVKNKLMLVPTPDSSEQIVLWYIPVAPTLSADTDTFDTINSYDEYIIADCAIKCAVKSEQDTIPFEKQKAFQLQRIEEAAENRDSKGEYKIQNVNTLNDDEAYWD